MVVDADLKDDWATLSFRRYSLAPPQYKTGELVYPYTDAFELVE